MQKVLKPSLIAASIMLSVVSQQVSATNGYSPTGFGTINKGMAGAGVAFPQDTMASATNPAGMAYVGHRWDVGVDLFNPSKRGYTANDDGGAITPGDYVSENDYFLIPHFGWNRQLTESSTLGVSLGANGGMNTEYDKAVFGNFGAATSPTGVDLKQLFLGVTYAKKVNDNHSLGIMPIFALQTFKATGLEPFAGFSSAPGNVSNKGTDTSTGYGVRVGWLGKMNDKLKLGASYQSRLYMSKFDDYKGLFAEKGDFDIPSTWTVGLNYQATPRTNVLLDYQRINYGEVNSIGNSNGTPLTSPKNFLGEDDGLGFGWEDMDIYKLGVQFAVDDKMTLRAGYSHASKLFGGTQALFNILAPATIQDHVSLGSSYQYSKNNALDVSLTVALDNEIAGSSPFTGAQTGSVSMQQWELGLNWSHRF